MNILQVNTTDIGGGAARTAWSLFTAYQDHGASMLAVGYNRSHHPNVYEIPGAYRSPRYSNVLWKLHGRLLRSSFDTRVWRDLLCTLAAGESMSARLRGREDLEFPGSRELLNIVPMKPDIVHCHNLHGGYFDLRLLTVLSRQVPIVLTLHDAWLLSGHCAHSFACERWRTGCGECPDLSIYPSILRDGTAANWREKQRILQQSRLFVATPSHWLMAKVEQSIVRSKDCRVIPNGVDLSIFKPGIKEESRRQLGLPGDVDILLYVGSTDPDDSFKDYGTLRTAVLGVSLTNPRPVWLICLGVERPMEVYGDLVITFKGYVAAESELAYYYQASDICVHSAKAENFPYSVLEAMACGVAVIASSVGGIPEQIRHGDTGMLVPPQDAESLAQTIQQLLVEESFRERLADGARLRAEELFDQSVQINAYLSWYSDILMMEG